ncbi:MAG: hypothetical protein HC769_01665 [Cyanobacteria bacterium CRU_2_1]|nr:hypothetical protein [Cyanobacteria bacterium RU_5_0]NJR57671.1 hypothetical protein [Cyanobacteria bacterium CRU_2_1]
MQIRYSLFAVFLGVVITGLAGQTLTSNGLAQTNSDAPSPLESEARNYIGSLNRSQQAYQIENSTFSPDIQSLGIGVPTEDQNYLYRVYTLDDPGIAVMNAAIPKEPELRSYVGLVWVVDSRGLTAALLCRSDASTIEEPNNPGMTNSVDGLELTCPEGYSPN